MAGPRSYSSGTRAGLFSLGKGTCYFPGCEERVVKMVGDEPEIAVQIAHIRGALPGSTRYDESMTDEERAAFSNLILLCTPHHNQVDKRHPERFPVDVLTSWKSEHEAAAGVQALPVNESDLLELLRASFEAFAPKREASVSLTAAVLTSEGPLGGAFGDVAVLLEHNAHLRPLPLVLVTTVRNSGGLPISVTEVDLHFQVSLQGDATTPGDFVSKGRNDMPAFNPALPHRILDGEAMNWFLSSATIFTTADAATSTSVKSVFAGIQAHVTLATGERLLSELVPWSGVGAAGFPVDGSP